MLRQAQRVFPRKFLLRHALVKALLCGIGLPMLAQAANTPVAATPVATTQPSLALDILGIVLPLIFVIAGLLIVLQLLRKRYGLTGSDTALSVVQILPVGPRERVVLVRTRAGKILALGVATQSVNLLTQLDEADVGPLKSLNQTSGLPASSSLAERLSRWRDSFPAKRS